MFRYSRQIIDSRIGAAMVMTLLSFAMTKHEAISQTSNRDPISDEPRPAAQNMSRPSPQEVIIYRQLNGLTTLEFSETPLADVAQFLQQYHGIPILFDTPALESEGIDPTSDSVTIDLEGIRLKSGLRLLLNPLNLGYRVSNDVLQISSKPELEDHLTTRVYRLHPQLKHQPQDLIRVILSTIEPESWDEMGGPGTIASLPGLVVMSQTESVYQRIEDLFDQLSPDRLSSDESSVDAEFSETPSTQARPAPEIAPNGSDSKP